MTVSIGDRLSTRSLKSTLAILSVLGVLSTLVVYRDAVQRVSNEIISGSGTERDLSGRRLKLLAKERLPPRKTLIWLLGHPNAGSNRVIDILERATEMSMGTNYGDIAQDYHRKYYTKTYESNFVQKVWYRGGPFVNNVDLEIDNSEVIVKTYCTGHCLYDDGEWCDRIPYIRSLVEVGKFWQTCAIGSAYLPPRTKPWNKAYWKNRVKKVILLVRNPMEIVQSKMIVWAKATGARKARTGLVQFCEIVDAKYSQVKEIARVITRIQMRAYKHLTEEIPCWTEFIRILYWYKHAWTIASSREHIVVHYQDFVDDNSGTTTELLQFAGYSWFPGRTSDMAMNDRLNMMYQDTEIKAISEFMQAVGRFQDQSFHILFERYFHHAEHLP